MKVYICKPKQGIDAIGDYSSSDGTLTVLKGSTVSEQVTHTATFRGASSIEKQRADTVEKNVVIKNVCFKSPSTAANFVTGRSTNGLIAWRDEDGMTIKELRDK